MKNSFTITFFTEYLIDWEKTVSIDVKRNIYFWKKVVFVLKWNIIPGSLPNYVIQFDSNSYRKRSLSMQYISEFSNCLYKIG